MPTQSRRSTAPRKVSARPAKPAAKAKKKKAAPSRAKAALAGRKSAKVAKKTASAKKNAKKKTKKALLSGQGRLAKKALAARPGHLNSEELTRFVEDLKRQWMSTIDALVDPLMIVDRDFKIRRANLAMARMGGLDVKELVGRRCHEVFADRKTPCAGCPLEKAAMQKDSLTVEIEGIRDGRTYEVTSQPLYDSAGRLDGIVQVYRDRTEARRLQEQLAQQEKLASIGLLAGGVAHEINNPLGGILIFSQMLLRELPQSSPHYSDVVEIEAATQRCKAIVESLLDFARQNPGEASKRAPVDVVEAVRTAIRLGRVQSGSQVDIKEDFQGTSHLVLGDRNKLTQLFLNLIQNALQAMPDGGILYLRSRCVRAAEGELIGRYEVEDNGIGIPPEHLKKVFDPFFTTKDPGEGTGLGLALCYSILQDLGGTMSVESTVNVGTRFIIEIPLTTAGNLGKEAQA